MTIADFNDFVKELKTMQNKVKSIPADEINIFLEDDDNRQLDTVDMSEVIDELEYSIQEALENIEEVLRDIYKNAIDERESYSVNSMDERALWLDEVCIATDCVIGAIHNG